MKHIHRLIGSWLIAIAMSLSGGLLLLGSVQVNANEQRRSTTQRNTQTASANATYQRAYPYGYRDGYNAGRSDFRARNNRDFRTAQAYQEADRGYRSSEDKFDFQAGYRLGYEMGYVDGYYGRSYSTRIPTNAIALRTVTEPDAPAVGNLYVPNDLKMMLRLTSTINTKTNQRGDRFTATVVEPQEFAGATVTGHIAQLKRSGRVTGKTELSLAFDSITMRDGRTGDLRAEVTDLVASESVKSVDEEGNIETASRTKDTAIRSGGGAALGAIIGAIAGGGKGAAIGALIGAGVGAGSVFVQGDKDLILEPGTEMEIRTMGPANTRR
jgi:hypothetical protein